MEIWMDVDAALSKVPVNIMPLIDDTDFKSKEESVAYNAAGLDLVWNFVTTAGTFTQTAVTPTESAGDYDWSNLGNGQYAIEIPASGGASINNDTEGFGWFTGVATGILPWRGPVIGFRASAINNALIDGGDVLDVSLTEIGGVAQSATDLKDFADTGYDPSTHKVAEVATLTGHTAQTGDAYAQALIIRKLQQNKMAFTIGETTTVTVYDDDGTTPLYEATLTDKDGNAVVARTVGPINRTAFGSPA